MNLNDDLFETIKKIVNPPELKGGFMSHPENERINESLWEAMEIVQGVLESTHKMFSDQRKEIKELRTNLDSQNEAITELYRLVAVLSEKPRKEGER